MNEDFPAAVRCGCAPCQGCQLEDLALVQAENLALAAALGDLRNQLDAIREVAVSRAEKIAAIRTAVASDEIHAYGKDAVLRNVRLLVGVRY